MKREREEITGRLPSLRELKILKNLITNIPNLLTSFPEARKQNRMNTAETDDFQRESPMIFLKFINKCPFHHSLIQYGICGL